jgi:hypothetical protein
MVLFSKHAEVLFLLAFFVGIKFGLLEFVVHDSAFKPLSDALDALQAIGYLLWRMLAQLDLAGERAASGSADATGFGAKLSSAAA